MVLTLVTAKVAEKRPPPALALVEMAWI